MSRYNEREAWLKREELLLRMRREEEHRKAREKREREEAENRVAHFSPGSYDDYGGTTTTSFSA